jgi:hypothetical protein
MTRNRATLGLLCAGVLAIAAIASRTPGSMPAQPDLVLASAVSDLGREPLSRAPGSVEEAIARAAAEGDLELAASLAAAEVQRVNASKLVLASSTPPTTAP